jgi:hypothetical protein
MIDLYQLTDAFTAALFGIFALWAAGSQRHWFVRTAVVSAALLILLLIPAYEPLIKFGVQILVVLAGISIWRKRRKRNPAVQSSPSIQRQGFLPRISLETLMLVTVVVAVVTAVAARAPHFAVYQWYEHVFVGAAAGVVTLIPLWIVFGQTRWWIRLVAVPPLVYWMALAMYWLWISRWALQHWITSPSFLPQYWQGIVNAGILSGGEYNRGTIGVGLAVVSAWLVLVRAARWFDPFNEAAESPHESPRNPRWTNAARWAATTLFVLVSIFPLVLFYRLMTPAPIPDLSAPRPNGFDELVAAGRLIGETEPGHMRQLHQLPVSQLRDVVKKDAAALEKIHEVIQHDCRFPLTGVSTGNVDLTEEELRALGGVCNALCARILLAVKEKNVEEQLAAHLDFLRLALIEQRSSGVDKYDQHGIFSSLEYSAVYEIWNCTTTSSDKRCIELARDLAELDAQRISWAERVAHERIAEENSDWESHLRAILDDWSGVDRFADRRPIHLENQLRLRILNVELAVRAFKLRTARLPVSLGELVPDFIPAIPQDPFGQGELKYRVSENQHVIYSVGWNKVDNGGTAPANPNDRNIGDLTAGVMFPPRPSQPAVAADSADEVDDAESNSNAAQ